MDPKSVRIFSAYELVISSVYTLYEYQLSLNSILEIDSIMSAGILKLLRHSGIPFHLGRNFIFGSSSLVNQLSNYRQSRFLNLQEYQSKQILHENGIAVQRFKVVTNSNEVEQVLSPKVHGGEVPKQTKWSGISEDISQANEFVIKAQILAGGRGKGKFLNSGLTGGVQLTKDKEKATNIAKSMLNDYLITKQTGDDGVFVERVMIAEAVNIKKEFYFAIVFDRSFDSGPILVMSSCGGMDIEEVALKNSDAIKKFTIPIDEELDLDTVKRIVVLAFDLNLNDTDIINRCAEQISRLHQLFLRLDATQIEINPLSITNKREVICVDAKINFDENARFRHKWVEEVENMNKAELDQRDYEAKKHNLNFIGLDGSIGCLVNGAGLAMATMDIIKLHGGEPANFLDIGGGATLEQVKAAFKIINSDSKVKAIFVNIFGGIMRCDTVAQGIIEATEVLDLKLPIVVRLEGTRVDEARKLISESRLNIISCDDFDEAAKRVVRVSSS